jgi:hypothetical protein
VLGGYRDEAGLARPGLSYFLVMYRRVRIIVD